MADSEEVEVEKVDATTYSVTVRGATTTEHTVRVDPVYYEKLTGGAVPPEDLVEESFEFLLEREPNTAILRSFDLPDIGNYFAEYEDVIRGEFE